MNFDQIRQDTKALSDFATKLDNLIAEIGGLESRNPGSNLTQLSKKVADCEKHLAEPPVGFTLPPHLLAWLEAQKQRIEERKRASKFANDLSKSLKSLDLNLQGATNTGLEVGFLLLKLDIDRDRVKIFYGNEKELLTECDIRVGEVKNIIEKYLKKDGLASNSLAVNLFAYLKEVYQRVIQTTKPTPDGVPINKLLPELALLIQDQKFRENPARENYRSYTRANFSYDLFRLKERVILPRG